MGVSSKAGFILGVLVGLVLSSWRAFSGWTTTMVQQTKLLDAPQASSSASSTRRLVYTNPHRHDPLQFVFIMGLESTGHHFLIPFLEQSPAAQQTAAVDGLADLVRSNALTIWNANPRKPDLFSQHCYDKNLAAASVHTVFDRVVQNLVTARAKVAAADHPATVRRRTVGIQMVSYPTNFGPCRPMHYADVDLLYRACEAAAVNCAHILLYRNPYDIIYGKRGVNPGILEAIKVYSTMLSVMYRQLQTFPDRTLACWGLFETPALDSTWTSLRKIQLWDDTASFDAAVNRTWRTKTPMTDDVRHTWFPPGVQPAMQTLLRQHEQVVELCLQQVQQYRPWWMDL